MSHKTAAEFVGVLLHSSTAAHYLHLNTASYAAHKALGHYYENIIALADKYAESYQGHFGIIPLDDYPDGFKVQKDAAAYADSLLTFVKGIRGDLRKDTDLQNIIEDAAAYANSLLTFVKGIRGDLPKDTDLQNIIDEIVGEISAFVYKLERFK